MLLGGDDLLDANGEAIVHDDDFSARQANSLDD